MPNFFADRAVSLSCYMVMLLLPPQYIPPRYTTIPYTIYYPTDIYVYPVPMISLLFWRLSLLLLPLLFVKFQLISTRNSFAVCPQYVRCQFCNRTGRLWFVIKPDMAYTPRGHISRTAPGTHVYVYVHLKVTTCIWHLAGGRIFAQDLAPRHCGPSLTQFTEWPPPKISCSFINGLQLEMPVPEHSAGWHLKSCSSD